MDDTASLNAQSASTLMAAADLTSLKGAPKLLSPLHGDADIAAGAQPGLSKAHGDFAAFHQGYVSQYIGLADTKAGLTFSFDSALIAWLIGKSENQTLLLHPGTGQPFVALVTALSLLALSGYCAFRVIAPRLGTWSKEGIVFFGAVAKKTSASLYVGELAAKDETSLIEARLGHSYDLARICSQKYRFLRWAMWLALPALFATMATMVVVGGNAQPLSRAVAQKHMMAPANLTPPAGPQNRQNAGDVDGWRKTVAPTKLP